MPGDRCSVYQCCVRAWLAAWWRSPRDASTSAGPSSSDDRPTRRRRRLRSRRRHRPPRPASCRRRPIDAMAPTGRRGPGRRSPTAHPLYAGARRCSRPRRARSCSATRGRLRAALRRRARHRAAARPVDPDARTDTIFDLASVSKLFTSIVVDAAGRGGQDRPRPHRRVATSRSSPPTARRPITVRQLLTHTSGFPCLAAAVEQRSPTPAARMKAVYDAAARQPARQHLPLLRPQPDHARQDRRAGHRQAARRRRPRRASPRRCGMTRHRLQPGRPSARIAATEYQTGAAARHGPRRGARRERLVAGRRRRARGRLLHRRRPRGPGADHPQRRHATAAPRILSANTVDALLHELQRGVPGRLARPRLRARPALVHGRLSVPGDRRPHRATPAPRSSSTRRRGRSSILLTNRVHPSRNWGSINPARRAVGPGLAAAMRRRPAPRRRRAWFSGRTTRRPPP